MTGQKQPVKRRRILRWLVVLILLVVVGLLAWHRFQQPPEFILVTRIARAHPTECEDWVPEGLLQQNIPDSKCDPCEITLTGWDGRQRWRITSPVATLPERPGDHPYWNERTIAVSPDGRTVALLFTDGPYTRVYAWRNGALYSSVNLPRVPGKPVVLPLYQLSVTDRGYLWVSTPALRTCRLWRIDGKQVASGNYTVPFSVPKDQQYSNELSPDNSVLLCSEPLPYPNPNFSPNRQYHYVAIKVHDARIVFDHRYTINQPLLSPIGDGFFWHDNIFYGPDGKMSRNAYIERYASKSISSLEASVSFREQYEDASSEKDTNPKLRRTTDIVISQDPSHPDWVIPHSKRSQVFSIVSGGIYHEDPGACTRNGQYALVFMPATPLKPDKLFSSLKHIPVFGSRVCDREKLVFLSLYERPGKLLARLPLYLIKNEYDVEYQFKEQDTTYIIKQWALSPDGRHIGLTLYNSDIRTDYHIYRVK